LARRRAGWGSNSRSFSAVSARRRCAIASVRLVNFAAASARTDTSGKAYITDM
jgi:hypothetical protein